MTPLAISSAPSGRGVTSTTGVAVGSSVGSGVAVRLVRRDGVSGASRRGLALGRRWRGDSVRAARRGRVGVAVADGGLRSGASVGAAADARRLASAGAPWPSGRVPSAATRGLGGLDRDDEHAAGAPVAALDHDHPVARRRDDRVDVVGRPRSRRPAAVSNDGCTRHSSAAMGQTSLSLPVRISRPPSWRLAEDRDVAGRRRRCGVALGTRLPGATGWPLSRPEPDDDRDDREPGERGEGRASGCRRAGAGGGAAAGRRLASIAAAVRAHRSRGGSGGAARRPAGRTASAARRSRRPRGAGVAAGEVRVEPGGVGAGRGARRRRAAASSRARSWSGRGGGAWAHERPSPWRAASAAASAVGDGLALHGEGLAEALAGAGEERAGRDVRHAERGGELEAGHVVELGEQEGGALALGDALEGPLQLARQPGVHHEVLGRRRRVARLADQRHEPHDPLAAEVVERDAMGDLVQPRAGVLGLLERVVGLVGLDERVLGEVRGELGVAEHAHAGRRRSRAGAWRTAPRRSGRPRPGPRRRSRQRPPGRARRCSSCDGVGDHAISWADDRSCPPDPEPRAPGRCDEAACTGCDGLAPPAAIIARGCSGGPVRRRSPAELLDRVLRRHRVDRQPGAELEARDLAQPRVDLPVPVVGRVDLLVQRRRVEHEVVAAGRRGSRRAGRAPGGAPRRSRRCRGRWRGRSRRHGGAGRPRPRTASGWPTGRRRPRGRPRRGGGPGAGPPRARAGSTGTRPRG